MKYSTVAAALLAFVACAHGSDKATYEAAFTKFMVDFEKTYSHEEFQSRFATFKDNFDFVQQHDAEAAGFSVGINEFADMTTEEFAKTMNGFSGASQQGELHEITGLDIPTSADWRSQGAVTGIKNQGQCGSCWSFSTTGSLEGAWEIAGNTLVGLSEKNLMDCSSSEGNMGCDGGLMDNAFKYIIKNNGIDSEASYPYVPQDGSCQFNPANVAATMSSYKDIPQGSESSLTDAIANVGPISVAIDASHQSFQMYTSGVYYEPDCSSSQLDHGVLAVGYGTDSGSDYYIVKNSWGTSWGQSGYIWMSRNRNNNCGIATSASYPIV